jgi:tetratricopeptide (TPR) repeat protein
MIFAGFAAGLFYWMNRPSGIADLDSIRRDAREMFSATHPDARRLHAQNCTSKAESLAGEPGVLDTTARLYLIAVAPVTGAEASRFPVPEADLVREVATEDLLLITRLFFKTQRLRPADQLLDLLLSRADADRSAVLSLAIEVRFDLGRDEDVLLHSDELISLRPGDSQPYRFKGKVFRNRGHWDHFVDAMERAVELTEADDPVLKIELADGYMQLGRTADGRRLVDAISKDHADLIAQAPIMNARLLLQEGKIAESKAILDEFLDQVPGDAEALIVKGTLLVGQEQFEAAIEVLERAIAEEPSEEQAYYQMGQAYARLGKDDLATAFLNQHRQILDAKVRLHELEHKAALNPQNVAVRTEIADLYAQIGLPELADFWHRAADAARN